MGPEARTSVPGLRLMEVAMRFEQIAAEALRMSLRERALLASSLWESLSDPYAGSSDDPDDAAIALARERDRQIEAGEVHPIGHEDLMRRLRR